MSHLGRGRKLYWILALAALVAGGVSAQTLTLTTNDGGTSYIEDVGNVYTLQMVASGGTPPYYFSIFAGSLPAGQTINSATGLISGPANSTGNYSFTVQVKDSATPVPATTPDTIEVTVLPDVAITTSSPLPGGVAGVVYSTTLVASGGYPSGDPGLYIYTWSVNAGGLPPGLALNAGSGVISGTPTAQGIYNPMISVTDNTSGVESGTTFTGTFSLTIAPPLPPLIITPTSLPAGTVLSAYGPITFTATGGTGSGYTWSATGLPNGLSFSAAGVLSGTPALNSQNTYTPQFTVKDSGNHTANVSPQLVINPLPPLVIPSPTSLPTGMVGSAYGPVTFTASGGTGTGYTWSATGLPGGLSFTAGGVLSGTPAAGSFGSYSPQFTVKDSNNDTDSVSLPLTINPPTLNITGPGSLPAGTVLSPYGPVTFTASGGTGSGYTWSATGLPNGLSFSAGGVLSGGPATGSQGNYNPQFTVKDSGNDTKSVSLALTIGGGGGPPNITGPASLTAGTVGSAYAPVTFTASGGTGTGYTWSATGLPSGLSFSAAGVLSGTPATGSQGSYTPQFTVKDSGNNTASVGLPLTINPPPSQLSVTGPTSLPAGAPGSAYGPVTFTASGGTGSGYTWSATGLPGGLSFSAAGVLSGTPATGSQGSYTPQFTVKDSGNNTASVSLPLTINPPPPQLSITGPTSLPVGAPGSAYGPLTFTASGGTGSGYTWSATGLPSGLSFSTTGVLSGTPATAGSSTPQFTVKDSGNHTANVMLSLTITSTLSVTGPASLPTGTVGLAYGPVTFTASGGTGTGYTWSTVGLPSGLSFSASGVLSGTPATGSQGSYTPRQYTVTDSGNNTASVSLTITINLPNSPISITGPTSLPAGVPGSAYGPVSFTASGGTGGYSWSATGLPNGLTFSAAGVLSGTPVGGSYIPQFTVKDSSNNTASVSLSLAITLPSLIITGPNSLSSGTVGSPYGPVSFTASGGTAGGYSWSATGLPSNLSMSAAGVLSGTPAPGNQGSYSPRFTVTDSSNSTNSVNRSLTINPPNSPSITGPASLPAGTAGSAYGPVTFSASGGTGIYTWAASGLPNGLSFSTAGVLSGTPASGSAGNYSPTFTVTDSNNSTAFTTDTLTINPSPTTISVTGPATLPAGSVGSAYGPVTFSATGGTPGYTWSATGLPNGLNFSAAGVLSGTPATGSQGASNPQFTVKDSNNNTANVSLSLIINNASPSFTITTTQSQLPPGPYSGVVYPATTFTASTGGALPYKWSSSSTFPGSMSFSTGGVLSGTPTGTGSFPFTVTVTDSSTPPLTATGSFSLSVTPVTGPLLSVSSLPLSFSYVQGDPDLPPSQNIGVLSTPAGTPVTVTSTASGGGTWLTASASFSKTPGTIVVSVNPIGLGKNTYTGQVTITAPSATPSSVTVSVTLVVTASEAPQLTVTQFQSFALPSGGNPSQGAVVVSNTGGGTITYSAAATSNGNWLTLTGGSVGIVTPSTPSSITFTVNSSPPQGLNQGQITVTGSGMTQKSTVDLLVSPLQAIMQLSQAGLTFYAVQNSNVSPPPQSVAVFNLWGGDLQWNTEVVPVTSQSWLTVTPSGGSIAGAPAEATVSVNPAGLPKGQYYATVYVVSPGPTGAFNSPQLFSVLLNVVDAGELGSSPQVSTSGTILVAAAGSAAAATQTINLFSPAGASPSYSTSVFPAGSWLSVTPATGSLGANGTASLTIQASAAALPAGVSYGTVQVAFSDGTVQTIQVELVATPGAGAAAVSLNGQERPAAATCTPTKLVVSLEAPGANAQLQVGAAQTFQVQIKDDCGNVATPSTSTSAYLAFSDDTSNSDPPKTLNFDNSTQSWTASWTPPVSAPSTVLASVVATQTQNSFGSTIGTPPLPPMGSYVDVTVLPAPLNSAAQPAAAINGASFDKSTPGFVVPGGYVSIYGSGLANGLFVAQGGSLPTSLNGNQLLFEGQPLPLLFVSPGQVNGLVPQGVALNASVQLQVLPANGTQSVPVSATVTDLQPGIFTTNEQGTGQGSILINGSGTVAGPPGPGAGAGEPGTVYRDLRHRVGRYGRDGRIETLPPADGQPAPGSPLFRTAATATVTIGGVTEPAYFAGLAPGYVALYQVDALVPLNAPTGSAVPLVLTMTDSSGYTVSSQTVTIAVQ